MKDNPSEQSFERNSCGDQITETDSEFNISPKQLRKKIFVEVVLIAIIAACFNAVFIALIENNVYRIEIFSLSVNADFVLFLGVVIFIFFLVFCIKKQDKIILKSLLLFSVFSFLCALSVLMNSEILFIFDMAVTFILAVIAVRSFNGILKRLFIPFMSVLFLLSFFNGYLQLFADYSVDFSADYFYISSRQITQNKDDVHHYSSEFYSSDFFEETEFVGDLYIISTHEQFERLFLNNNGSYFWNASNENKNVIGKCFADMLKETEKYDEAFFSEYVLMPVCKLSRYSDISVEIDKVSFRETKRIVEGLCYVSQTRGTESDNIETVCICLIQMKKADIQGLLSQISRKSNMLSGGQVAITDVF